MKRINDRDRTRRRKPDKSILFLAGLAIAAATAVTFIPIISGHPLPAIAAPGAMGSNAPDGISWRMANL